MYRLKSKVRYSEAIAGSKLSYHALFNYLQDTSTLHSEELGETGADLLKEDMAWILSFWQVCIDKRPMLSDDITVSTWPYSTRGLFGLRNFQVEDANAEQIIKANSIWVLIQASTGRPIRIPDSVSAHYPDEPKLDMDYCDRKIIVPEEYEEQESIVVPQYFIDTNNHVNNAKYIMLAEQYLPEDFDAKEIRVEYKLAAVLGDLIVPRVTVRDNEVIVALVTSGGQSYATIQFIGR